MHAAPQPIPMHPYRTALRRQTQAAVVECNGLRQRGTPRPTKRLYKAATGEKDPLAIVERYVEDLMRQRDHVPPEKHWIYDSACMEFVDRLARMVLDARAASEARIGGALAVMR